MSYQALLLCVPSTDMETKKLQASLEKACGQSELFQRKNAKLEKDNDQLRVENQVRHVC